MGGIYPADISLFAFREPPLIPAGLIEAEMEPWEAVEEVRKYLAKRSDSSVRVDLYLAGHFENPDLNVCLIEFFFGNVGRDLIPDNDQNCSVVVYDNAKLNEALFRMLPFLVFNGLRESDAKSVDVLLKFTTKVMREGGVLVGTVSNPL